ncbi:MAG: GTPase ObgE [Candidatus Kapaibacteriales bacterium]
MKFIDTAQIFVRAGNGGKGIISFHREKYVPKGGPDGGNGGKGGDIILRAYSQLSTLLDFKYVRYYKAGDGKPGGPNNKTGKSGSDKIILVPCGTLVKDAQTNELIVDLVNDGDQFVVARGGRGGRGNAEFATPTNQTPRVAEDGEPGEERNIILELKVIADVGIVGFPNVGKSTLISKISSAKPKIADYPFTTLVPNLGVVKIGVGQSFVVADIPGIIEKASEGKGLGIQFLRHIERTKALLFLIDVNTENPAKDFKILTNELKKYNQEILKKEILIAFSKLDTIDSSKWEALSKTTFLLGRKKVKSIFGISSVSGLGIEELKLKLWDIVSKFRLLPINY